MGRWGRSIAVTAVAVVVALGFGSAPAALAAEGGTVHSDYVADPDPDLRNPERGLFATMDSLADIALPGNRFLEAAAEVGTTAHVYVDLSAYYPSALSGSPPVDTTIPDEVLAAYDQAFANIRRAGLTVILRFSYTPKGTQVCGGGVDGGGDPSRPDVLPDADIATIEGHIRQVAAVLWSNADVIASLEAGFLGEFGEWHCSVNSGGEYPRNGVPIDESAKQAVLDLERELFPPLTIQMRYPADIRSLASTERIGSHQDCYASTENDAGTWPADAVDRRALIDLVGSIGETAAVSATVCASYPERVNCTVALQSDELGIPEMPAMRFSLFAVDGGDQAPWLEPYRQPSAGWPDGCWDDITASLGYRLALLSSDLPGAATAGGSMHVVVDLENTGFAAPFDARPVSMVLSGDNGHVEVPLGLDAAAWGPGVWRIDQDVTFPADLPDGDYTVSLALPDASPRLSADPRYAVRLANVGTWEAETGTNRLGVVRVGGSPPRLPATGSGAPVPWALGIALAGAGVGILLARRGSTRRPR